MAKWWMWCDIGSCPNFAKQSIIDSKKKGAVKKRSNKKRGFGAEERR